MNLKEYLNKYFADGMTCTLDDSKESLEVHFAGKFGVDIKNEENLYLFKYNMITAKWCFPITHECRGVILRFNNGWEYVSRPYSKFFNLQEGNCVVNDTNWQDNFQIIEKADGTAIQVWYDNQKDQWRISTLGTITPMHYSERNTDTFDKLFLKTVKVLDYNKLDKKYTYLFELCSFENRIVTQYEKDVVYLIAVREIEYGNYFTDQLVDELALVMMEDGSNIKRPVMKFMYELDLHNFDEVKAWVEKESESETYGKFPEGFVVYRGGVPVAKIKNSKYLEAHNISGGNIAHARNAIIEATFVGNIDDIYPTMIPELQEYADGIRDKVSGLVSEAIHVGELLRCHGEFSSQKDYALFLQAHCDKGIQPFFYQNKGKLNDISVQFTKWLKDHYSRFMEMWKERD